MQIKNQKGITLMVLIITIVIMLILASVTIKATIETGLIKKSGSAAGSFNNSIVDEQNEIKGAANKIDDYVRGN